MNAWRLARVAALLLLLPVTGCGPDSAADRVPALADRLDQVDDAIADGRWGAAREALDALEDTVADAHADGDLSDDQTAELRAAADDLRAALPEQRTQGPGTPPESTEPTEPTEPTETAGPSGSSGPGDKGPKDKGPKDKGPKDKGPKGPGPGGGPR